MEYRRMGDRIVARLAMGEEIIESLRRLARTERIPSGSLAGLGAVRDVTLALYDLPSRSYKTRRFTEDLELVSMTGNLSWLGGGDGEPVIHAHGVVSREDATTLGGHIMSATVSVTVEAMVTVYPDRIVREPDETVGLKLLALG